MTGSGPGGRPGGGFSNEPRGNRGNYGHFNEDGGSREWSRGGAVGPGGGGGRPGGSSSFSGRPSRGGERKSYQDDAYMKEPAPGLYYYLFRHYYKLLLKNKIKSKKND